MPHLSLTITGLPVREARNGFGFTTEDLVACRDAETKHEYGCMAGVLEVYHVRQNVSAHWHGYCSIVSVACWTVVAELTMVADMTSNKWAHLMTELAVVELLKSRADRRQAA